MTGPAFWWVTGWAVVGMFAAHWSRAAAGVCLVVALAGLAHDRDEGDRR